MADLIELNIVANDDNVKQAVATVSRLERQLIKAVKAINDGNISQKRFNKVLQSAKNEYKSYAGNAGLATININKFVAAQKGAISSTNDVTSALNRNSNALQQTRRGTNQLGVLFQQTGYQVGDFAVQVQSGTNVMVAFGQQATQLVGTFAMLARSTAAIAAFSTLGIVIPIATALAGAFMRARDSADDLGASVKEVFDSIVARSASIGDLLEVTFTGSLEVARQQLIGVQEVFQRLDQQAFQAKMAESGSELNEVYDTLNERLRETAQQIRLIESGRTEGDVRFSDLDLEELKKQQDALQEFYASIAVARSGPIEGMASAFVEAYTNLQEMSSVVAKDIAPEFKKLLEDTGLLTQFEKELTEAAKAQAKEKREQAQETAQLISESLSNSDKETAALERRNAAIEGFKTKYNKLTEAQMDSELGVNEATRRAREELELINLARANNIKLTGTEYQQLIKILRTYQAQRKEAEDNLEITRIQKDATDALVQAEFKVLQAEVDLLRAKGKNNDADSLAVKLAGDRAYQAIMAKAETEEEAAALQDAANEARQLATEAARVANGTRDAKEEAQELAKATREAERAMSALANMGDNLDKGLIKAQARVQALKNDADAANAAVIAGATFDLEKTYEDALFAAESFDEVIQATKEYNEGLATLDATAKALAEGEKLEEAARNGKKAMDEAAKSAEELAEKIQELEDAADPFRAYNRELKDLKKMLDKNQISQKAYNKAVDDLNDGLGDTIPIIGDVEQAFSDWLVRGLDDFKSFVSSIKDMFVRLLADLAAQAVRNRILIPITTGFMAGMGSTAAASTMQGMTAGSMGSTLAGYGAAIGTGLSNFGSAALHTITGGSMGSVAAGSTMASIGAVAPYILAAVAVIGLFSSKVKKLDEGIRVTVNNMDTLVESFEVLQKSRLFGLLKGKKFTEYEEVVDSPIVEAVASIQDSVLKAANSLGIASDAFDDFSYQFQVSLKGLTEEEKIQKVNEELAKMGDAFASLSGHFSNMNDLLAVAQQRYDLETRLLQLQGNNTLLLARQRERERAATHELNQGVLDQIYVLEDAQIAFNNLAASIQTRKDQITRSFNEIMETIQGKIQDASEAASKSASILSMLQGASGRVGMTREAGLDYLKGLRGVSRIEDDKALGEALQAIGEPSEELYGSFTDYQREFADQANIIRDLEEKAGVQVSNDEKMLEQLRLEAEAAEDRYETQIGYLDQQLQDAQDQLNALLGINEGVLGVQDALKGFADAVNKALSQAAAAAKAAAEAKAAADAGGDGSVLDKYGTGTQYKGYDHASLRGAQELLDAAKIAGVDTSGKTGAEIQQDISNATGLAIGLDTGTRDDQFALGGYHSGGVRLVGERGPELEATGPSRVYSANQTKRLMQNPDLVEAVKAMKQEITELRNEQRQLGINNNKYTKRTYDLYRQWDTEGLPAERT